MSKVNSVNARGQSLVKWEDRVLEYVKEMNVRGLEDARRECKVRNKWRLLCHGHPLG